MNKKYYHLGLRTVFLAAFLVLSPDPAAGQALTLDLGDQSGSATARLIQLILIITVISIAPSLLIMVTSFTRIVVVLAFLRQAMGTQQTPPNQVLISLALFLTVFIMMPTFERAYDAGIKPLIEGQIEETEAIERSVEPFRDFMMRHVRERDLLLFTSIARVPDEEARREMPLRV
ncbi:MAG: flagellar biosynthetic protein FliP, partial [Rhodospirillales bacterium]